MTQKGCRQKEWTTKELDDLKALAGQIPLDRICRQLDRSKDSVKKQAGRLGLSLKYWTPQLLWCNECATWRSSLDKRTGRCKVCTIREQLSNREAACTEVILIMSPRQRSIYEESESKRLTRSFPHRPRKISPTSLSEYEERKAEEAYLVALEDWEYRCLKLQYDAVKTRLRRMREKTGTNPRKKLR